MHLNAAVSSDGSPRGTEDLYVDRAAGIPRRLRGRLVLLGVAAAAALGACGNGSPEARTGGASAGSRPGGGQAADTAARSRGTTPAPDTAPRLTTLEVGGHTVKVEVADDDDERRRGLMNRDSLPEDQGMLFVYPEQRTLSFWMRNTDIPLDIAYIDQQGFIVDIQRMDPHTEELHPSSRPAMYALEMNQGWFEAHDVGEGDRVRF